jgi:galactonate dehydratase
MITRRAFFHRSLLGAASLAFPGLSFLSNQAQQLNRKATGNPQLEVASVEATTVKVPYREIPGRAMSRELPHWKWSEILEVKLKAGVSGFGETLLYYTWGTSSQEDIQRCIGRNAAELMWDDSLGAGLQMALFDAVARHLEIPVHRLLGSQVNRTTPLSWWNIDTSAKDMASECQRALELGYRSYKTKGRPWFDIHQQVEQSAAVVPESFKIDMDFNSTLLDADRGMPIIKDLEAYPQVDIYESPIPQSDVAGNRRIREATRVNIALHYGTPNPRTVVEEGVCDGFVVGGGASSVLRQAAFCSQVNMPFWLQLVGTGLTAAHSLHFGAVCSHATWPAVNCHQLYSHDLLKQPILLKEGQAKVPETPGLGHELDWEMVERFRTAKPSERPNPRRMVEISWPTGKRMLLAATEVNYVLNAANRGAIPFYEKGADTRLLPDDGTSQWETLYQKALEGPLTL